MHYTFFTVSAAAAKSIFPILVEPVNPIFLTVSDSIRVSPAHFYTFTHITSCYSNQKYAVP